jgi:hypothetical protein
MVNEGEAVSNVVYRIGEVGGHSDLSKGMQIYPEIVGQAEAKK